MRSVSDARKNSRQKGISIQDIRCVPHAKVTKMNSDQDIPGLNTDILVQNRWVG